MLKKLCGSRQEGRVRLMPMAGSCFVVDQAVGQIVAKLLLVQLRLILLDRGFQKPQELGEKLMVRAAVSDGKFLKFITLSNVQNMLFS